MDSIEAQIDALEQLVRSPGWAILSEHMKKQSDQAFQNMRDAVTADLLVKHTYTHMALRDLPASPEVLLEVLRRKLTK